MGTDLAGWVELYNPLSEMWSNVIRIDALDNRNYKLYEKLFGFKAHLGNVGEVIAPRGAPPSPSAGAESDFLADITNCPQEYFGLTWIGWNEIEAIDWDKPLDDRVYSYHKGQPLDAWRQETWKSNFIQRSPDAWQARPEDLPYAEFWEYRDYLYRLEPTTGHDLWRDGWDVL
jgi:hypothetical protein